MEDRTSPPLLRVDQSLTAHEVAALVVTIIRTKEQCAGHHGDPPRPGKTTWHTVSGVSSWRVSTLPARGSL